MCLLTDASHANSGVIVALSAVAAASILYLYSDPCQFRRRMLERLWFLISKRNIEEIELERELIEERKYLLSCQYTSTYQLSIFIRFS